MDPKLLPEIALLDTTVIMRALGEHPNDPRSPDCRDFADAMEAHKKQMLVSAASIAEMIRGPIKRLPHLGGLVVVPFDDQAAYILAERFPMSALRTARDSTGLSLSYLKYDALIAATAIRHHAAVLVSLDGGMHKLAPIVNLRVAKPHEFKSTQGELRLVTPLADTGTVA